jgi:hypothetical protein
VELPLIRDPETGDPIGFVIDAEGRYVDRGEFEWGVGSGVEGRSKGLEPGDEVFMHGNLVHKEPAEGLSPDQWADVMANFPLDDELRKFESTRWQDAFFKESGQVSPAFPNNVLRRPLKRPPKFNI